MTTKFAKVLQTAMSKLTTETTIVKMTLPELGLHALKELRLFKSAGETPATRSRLKLMLPALKAGAEWLMTQEATALKALQWEDTASFTVDVPVYQDEAQLKNGASLTVDPRDNNAKPSVNSSSNMADFMASFKSVLAELAAETASPAAAPSTPAQKTDAPTPPPAPAAPATAAPVEPEPALKAETPKAELPISWPLDMANKEFLRGNKAPEQRQDFGKDSF